MHLPINVESPNNISKWQMGFNLAFKGLTFSCPRKTFCCFFAADRNNLAVQTDEHIGDVLMDNLSTAVLIEIFCDYPHYLEANVEIIC
jgi:hypothetical protein